MTEHEPMLAVFLEATDVRRVIAAWPDEMRLVVCLSHDGVCRLIVFHDDETAIMPHRLCVMFGTVPSAVKIVPEVQGYPTFNFRYTDEISVLSILETSEDLLDEAVDYEANFNFAKEEGLNPSKFMGLPVDVPVATSPGARQHNDVGPSGKLRPKRVAEAVPLLTQRHRVSVESARRVMFSSVRRSGPGLTHKQFA